MLNMRVGGGGNMLTVAVDVQGKLGCAQHKVSFHLVLGEFWFGEFLVRFGQVVQWYKIILSYEIKGIVFLILSWKFEGNKINRVEH